MRAPRCLLPPRRQRLPAAMPPSPLSLSSSMSMWCPAGGGGEAFMPMWCPGPCDDGGGGDGDAAAPSAQRRKGTTPDAGVVFSDDEITLPCVWIASVIFRDI